jgi:hypothetical protein
VAVGRALAGTAGAAHSTPILVYISDKTTVSMDFSGKRIDAAVFLFFDLSLNSADATLGDVCCNFRSRG